MKTSISKKLVLSLSLLISLCGLCSNTNDACGKMNNDKRDSEVTNSYNKLIKTVEWKKLTKLWKKMNHIEDDKNDNTRWQTLRNMQSEIDAAVKLIADLNKSNLLTLNEKEFLSKVFPQRYHFLEYQVGFVDCYEMTLMGSQIVQRREDLENRYDILENLFQKGKINSDAYNKAVDKIKEDLQFIQENSYQAKKTDIETSLIQLLINLNK